ncbi:MAG: sodium transporter, partial [Saprospiraceae bacterium]|nr:sodium transporter [Saprospiraceae bacterium]
RTLMNRMGVVFLVCAAIMVLISLIENKGADKKAIDYEKSIFYTTPAFNIASLVITGLLAVIYAVWW